MDLCKINNSIVRVERFDEDGKYFNINADIFARIISNCDNSPITVTKINELSTVQKEYNTNRSERFVIRVFYYKNNVEHTKDFFIKKSKEQKPHEVLNYLYLQNNDAPIPKLYAYYSEDNENDIMIMEVVEPLHQVGEDFMLNEKFFKPFIIATAEFNSVKISDEYKAFLSERWDIVNKKIIPYKTKLEQAFTITHEQEKYDKLKKYFSRKTLDVLLSLHEKMCQKIITMEKGIYHWDHSPYNSGWSALQNKHVIFDLEMTLWAPRFINIGAWIGGNDKKYAPNEELALLYLSIYNQRLGANISTDIFLYECYPLWIESRFQHLLWYFNDNDEKLLSCIDLLASSNL